MPVQAFHVRTGQPARHHWTTGTDVRALLDGRAPIAKWVSDNFGASVYGVQEETDPSGLVLQASIIVVVLIFFFLRTSSCQSNPIG